MSNGALSYFYCYSTTLRKSLSNHITGLAPFLTAMKSQSGSKGEHAMRPVWVLLACNWTYN